MNNKCLYCYDFINDGSFHEKCATEFFGSKKPPKINYSFNQIDELAKNVVERSIAVPGVQAKLSMSLIKDAKEQSDSRLTVVGALGGQFIFKPPSKNFSEMPENEHLTMKIAESYGIRVVPSTLIRLASGELSYLTKRIDRSENEEKIHMLDMFQITEAFDKYKSSMEKVGKALEQHSANPLLDKILLFELTLFSFLVGNNDMHLKNFSMIEDLSGWILAPAYDLLNVNILNPEDTEELALTLCGKKNKFKREHFNQFGESLGLTKKQIEGVYKRMQKNKKNALKWIDKSFLSDQMKESYKAVLNKRYRQVGLQ